MSTEEVHQTDPSRHPDIAAQEGTGLLALDTHNAVVRNQESATVTMSGGPDLSAAPVAGSFVPATGSVSSGLEPAMTSMPGTLEPAAANMPGTLEPAATNMQGALEPATSMPGSFEPDPSMSSSLEPAITHIPGSTERMATTMTSNLVPATTGMSEGFEPATANMPGNFEPATTSNFEPLMPRGFQPATTGMQESSDPAASSFPGSLQPPTRVAGSFEPTATAMPCTLEPASNSMAGNLEPASTNMQDNSESTTTSSAGSIVPTAADMPVRQDSAIVKTPRSPTSATETMSQSAVPATDTSYQITIDNIAGKIKTEVDVEEDREARDLHWSSLLLSPPGLSRPDNSQTLGNQLNTPGNIPISATHDVAQNIPRPTESSERSSAENFMKATALTAEPVNSEGAPDRTSEQSMQVSAKYPLLPPCQCTNLKCIEKIPEDRRKEIHISYWTLKSFAARRRWIIDHLGRNKKMPISYFLAKQNRQRWFLPDPSGNSVEVCKVFFLRTLGYKWGKIVDVMLKTNPQSLKNESGRQSGRFILNHKIREYQRNLIVLHIKSFLKNHFPVKAKCKGIFQPKFEFGLVHRCYQTFTHVHPSIKVSYKLFRAIFQRACKEFLTERANPSRKSGDKRTSKEPDNSWKDLLAASAKKTSVGKNKKDSFYEEENKVVMHLDIENDAVIITENVSDSEAEHEHDSINRTNQDIKDSSILYKHYPQQTPIFSSRSSFRERDIGLDRLREIHALLPPCACKRMCFDNFTEERRQEIHDMFWALKDYDEQNAWILTYITRSAPLKPQTGRRKESRIYTLPDDSNEKVRVCAVFFQRTLGYLDGTRIETVCDNTPRDDTPGGERRARRGSINKISEFTRACIVQHITNHLAAGSIDGGRDSGNKKKKKKRMSLTQLHAEFEKDHPESHVHYQKFRLIYLEILQHYEATSEAEDQKEGIGILDASSSAVVEDETENQDDSGRRRSTRKTRMQGNMAEDHLIELGGESNMVSSIVSSHKRMRANQIRDALARHARSSQKMKSGKKKGGRENVKKYPTLVGQLLSKPHLFTGSKRGRKAGMKIKLKKKKDKSRDPPKKRGRPRKSPAKDPEYKGDKEDSSEKLSRHSKLKALQKKHRHPMLPSCNCNRRKCIEKIPEERRREIHEYFWNMDSYKHRKRWLMKYVERRARKMKELSLFPDKRKNKTKNDAKKYYLPDGEGKTVEVCRLFFIHTLGFKWDSVVDVIVKRKKPVLPGPNLGSYVHKKPPRELPDYVTNSVREYIESIRDTGMPPEVKPTIDSDDTSKSGAPDNKGDAPNNVNALANGNALADENAPANGDTSEKTDASAQTDVLQKPAAETPSNSKAKNKKSTSPAMKMKELFTDYKVKYKHLKFNLGYQSFRRLVRGVVEPGPAPPQQTEAENQEDEEMDSDMEYDSDDSRSMIPPKKSEPEPPPSKKLPQKRKGRPPKSDKDRASGVKKKKKKKKKLKESDGSSSASDEEIKEEIKEKKPKKKKKENESSDEGFVAGGHDSDEGVLDVSSGVLMKPPPSVASGGFNYYPYQTDTKYKKKRALSKRNNPENYPVLPPCKCAKRKCFEKIPETRRQEINSMFWNLSGYNERKQWILEHIKRCDVKRRVVVPKDKPRKSESRKYYLPNDEGRRTGVCKAFFLRTLGYKWDSVIDTIGRTTQRGERWVAPDKRGRKPPPHKISEEAVSSMTIYIESVCQTYQPLYQQHNKKGKKKPKNNAGALVPYGLTMKQLFEDYKSKHTNHKFGYESFRKVFRKVYADMIANMPPPPEPEEPEIEEPPPPPKPPKPRKPKVAPPPPTTEYQPNNMNYMPNPEPFTNMGHYASPPPPPLPPNAHQPFPPQQQMPPPQPTGATPPERRSCLYQYSGPPMDTSQPHQHQPMHVPQTVSSNQGRFNTMEQDQLMKFGHNMYGPPVMPGPSGHIPQMSEPLPYNNPHNPRPDMNDPAGASGQNQFPPYFVSNPEPLRRQVYEMASQYQSILHHIAESSRLLNYGGLPPPESTFQGGQDKQCSYGGRQDYHRDNLNPYNVPKPTHNFVPDASAMPAHYPPHGHVPQGVVQHQGNAMVMSPFSEDNDFIQDVDDSVPIINREQDGSMNNEFGEGFPTDGKGKKTKKGRPSTKKKKGEPRKKREKKIRPKSARNYGDHYPMLGPCNCKKKKCTQKFTDSSRQRVHDMFWDLKDYNERKQWILTHIKRDDCKRRRIDQPESGRKMESRWYYFPDENDELQEVCKDFFLKTLGYKWDSVIDTIRRTTPKGETTARPDMRGRKPPSHKLSGVVIKSVVQYIESMQQASAPFGQDTANLGPHSSKKLKNLNSNNNQNNSDAQISIPYGLSMKDLFDDYKAKHPAHKLGYESFRRIFRALANAEQIVIEEDKDDMLNPDDTQNIVDF